MKEIILTHGKSALVNDEDFDSVNRFKWMVDGYGYAARTVSTPKRTSLKMHQFILGRPPSGCEIDHINHNRLDNRRGNLRFCTRQQNCMNSSVRKGSSSKYKGVGWEKYTNSWKAYIKHDGRTITLGRFKDEEVAKKAYNHAASEYFGEFAYLNP